ncbi:MAG: hypothetical protein ACE5J5_00275 [Candidatus Hydrothermarchaeales archaeon]
MNSEKYTCKDCVFFALSSGGLDEDMCEFFNKPLKRDDILKGKDCEQFRLREEGKGIEEYLPHKAGEKAEYKKEIKKYIIRSIVLVIIGIALFYYITTL